MKTNLLPKRILVVEDNACLLWVTTQILTEQGFEVFTASNGVECLRAIEEHRPDLVVLDLKLPRLSGGAVLEMIAQTPSMSGVRVIVVSGSGYPEDLFRSLLPRMVGYVSKPFTPDQLLTEIQTTMTIGPSRYGSAQARDCA